VRSKIQDALLSALEAILRPIAKLMLQSGIGYSEFASVAKAIFVRVATDDYKRRGRPANFSQVSAMTGISRKEVSKIRKLGPQERWTPNMEASPANTVLHEWHFDRDFSDGAGTAKRLPYEGPISFSALVSRYAGDIPPGAMRSMLQQAGIVTHDSDGLLSVGQKFFYARQFDEDFVRGLGFSLSSLGSTLVHNATVHKRTDIPNERKRELGRLERTAWSEHMTEREIAKLKAWVEDDAAPRFLGEAQELIGKSEVPNTDRRDVQPRVVGVGVYYFEED
jgi:Family of unknown function (DUF6502)